MRGAAHGLMAEAPNAFNDVVLTFLDEIDRAAAASAVSFGVVVSCDTSRAPPLTELTVPSAAR
jgi:hypothetical protein